MALTLGTVWNVDVTLRDRDRNDGSISVHVPGATAEADLIDYVEDVLIPAVNALSDAEVIGYSIGKTASDPVAATPAEASDVERKGVFTFRDAEGFTVTVSVPSIMNTLVVDNTNQIQATGAPADFVTAMVTGADGVAASTRRGIDLTALAAAKKTHRKSSKG
jgi:hypothetical protein